MVESARARSEEHRRWIAWSAIAAVGVVALSFATSDSALAGGIAATRYSARFSALVFALALAARGGRPWMLATNQVQLTLSFVAAHGIHYATVVGRAAMEPGNRLRHASLESLAVVAAGFGLLALLALTARAQSRTGARAHRIAFYLVGVLLAIALGSHARTYASSALAFSALAAAFLWRVATAVVACHRDNP
jgi:hypothetical protein